MLLILKLLTKTSIKLVNIKNIKKKSDLTIDILIFFWIMPIKYIINKIININSDSLIDNAGNREELIFQ